MTNQVFLGAGKIFPQAGLVTGKNLNGDTISGHRVEPGHWQLSNQSNGTQFDVNVNWTGPYKHVSNVDVTRTNAQGRQTQNDLTLIRGQGRGFGVYDFNQSGFQAIG